MEMWRNGLCPDLVEITVEPLKAVFGLSHGLPVLGPTMLMNLLSDSTKLGLDAAYNRLGLLSFI